MIAKNINVVRTRQFQKTLDALLARSKKIRGKVESADEAESVSQKGKKPPVKKRFGGKFNMC